MEKIVLAGLLICLFTSCANAGRKCCAGLGCFSDGYPFDHLPLPWCGGEVGIEFQLYTPRNPSRPARMTHTSIPGYFNNGARTVFIIHGYLNNKETEWVRRSRAELLRRDNLNVIVVGWQAGANIVWYPQSAANTRVVGAEVARLARAVIGRGLRGGASSVWCVGHSLGGHTCGHAGKILKIGRITGLDPAGPLFENYPNEAGLQARDADFVDVIHTMGKGGVILDFGTLKPLGDADFYPNGGATQPGCADSDVGCAHGRACKYFIESINSRCRFNVRMKCSNERDIPRSCYNCGTCQRMGYDATRQTGKFYLTTNGNVPYCKG